MNVPVIFQFLKELAANNNREWFKANYEKYEIASREYEKLLGTIINRITLFDEEIKGIEVKDCTYRIYRDVRFSHDKSPYKTHLGGYINAKGKKSEYCGYYIHLEPGNCLLAGGSYCPSPKLLKSLREAIYDNIEEYLSIIEDPAFKKYFPVVGETFLKTAPKGFPKDFKYIDYLKPKDFSCYCRISDDFFTSPTYLDEVEATFRQLKRFSDFMNYSINEFEEEYK
ncbi:DUF2461 domain-containing protein [Bacteroides sp. 214]|uniref:DUF2461 domain-containing protein n=1 Tax=Bacteroides sp. 214 TaxID=2302935 RepID=UPI0013CFA4A2|nr:DUF2461 domain-containing protein [Bacteroides sp. 214]NDW12717.1 DUF2461 domain-containing protein [Bacteroides sp. 214]